MGRTEMLAHFELQQMGQAIERLEKARDYVAAAERFIIPSEYPIRIVEDLDEIIVILSNQKYVAERPEA